MNPIRSNCMADDGVNIVFDIYGDCNAPERAVLTNSLAMDRAYWRPVAERLVRKGVSVASSTFLDSCVKQRAARAS